MQLPAILPLLVRTIGYAGQVLPEIRREGMEHAGDLREMIVRPCSRAAADTDRKGSGTGRGGTGINRPENPG